MKRARRQLRLSKIAGFTVVELMVVVLLIGALMTMSILSIRSLGGVEAKEELTRIAGLCSEIYTNARISSVTHRINFDLDNNNYWVEKEVAEAGESKPALGHGDVTIDLLESPKKKEEEEESDNLAPTFKPVEGSLGEKYQLPKALVIHGAWTDELQEVARTGIVSIYFFGGGYTQASFVSLAEKGDEENSSIYLALTPLTGAIATNYGSPK